MNLRLYATWFVLLFSALFAVQFVYLANGDIVNNYPYISPDGFDWYMEGVYVVKLFKDVHLPALPVLRPPIFVFLTAADYAAGGRGLILAMVFGGAIFFTYFLSLKIVDTVFEGGAKEPWYLLPLVVGSTIYPLNFVKPYLLSDCLVVPLSLASVLSLVKYNAEGKTIYLVFSVGISVIAGMTQTYGLIPYAFACGVGFLTQFRSEKKKANAYIVAMVTASVLFISFTLLWRLAMPHHDTPKNFDLLKLSTDMFGFYINTWGYYFFPFVVFFILFRRYHIDILSSGFVVLSSVLVVVFFALLCFFYQWPEARFTYYFWPWTMILFISVMRLKVIKGAYLFSMLMLMLVMMVPANYWAPSWKSVRFSISRNWVGDYFSASPIDRKIKVCDSDCEGNNEFLKKSDPYTNRTIIFYHKIKFL